MKRFKRKWTGALKRENEIAGECRQLTRHSCGPVCHQVRANFCSAAGPVSDRGLFRVHAECVEASCSRAFYEIFALTERIFTIFTEVTRRPIFFFIRFRSSRSYYIIDEHPFRFFRYELETVRDTIENDTTARAGVCVGDVKDRDDRRCRTMVVDSE